MKVYMKTEFSGIFRVKLVARNRVLGFPGNHFIHMWVKAINFYSN